ncbi:MAG TPA: hypothetical protein PL009_13445 [Flavipsychrobacter sp.]|nr:hypothetical protein [Flavipsychrobacter sp.]
MKKIIVFSAILLSIATFANAQVNSNNASGSAQQTVQLQLSNALEITFTGNGSANGATVAIPFTTANDYQNGVESTAQQLRIRSNKNFNIAVKTNASTFTVTNNGTTTASSMPASVLEVKVAANGTGGSIANGFSSYKDLSNTAANLITNGTYGGNQTFSVQYKAQPGFAYPAGTYAIDVVYTATQQ